MTYQIMCSSLAAEPMTAVALEKILADARTGNAARNVTGALIYVDGVFFQILEGDKAVVHELMANITRDSRQQSVTVFHEAQVEARAVESWRMAYLSPTPEQMSIWAGLAGTTMIEGLLADVNRDPHRVPRILVKALEALAD